MDKNQRIAHNHVKFLLNNDILLRNWNENAKSWKIAIYQISTNSWLKKNLIPIRILQKFCSLFWVIVMNYKVNKRLNHFTAMQPENCVNLWYILTLYEFVRDLFNYKRDRFDFKIFQFFVNFTISCLFLLKYYCTAIFKCE